MEDVNHLVSLHNRKKRGRDKRQRQRKIDREKDRQRGRKIERKIDSEKE